jgi:L-iditol 2-dehydrogenase
VLFNGLGIMVLARRRGAEVLMAGREDERLALARRLGAREAVKPERLTEMVIEHTGGLGADVVFECTGQVEVWASSVSYVRRGGVVVLFGGCPGGTSVTYDTFRLHYDEISLRGVFHYTPSDVRRAFGFLSEGLDLSALISGRHALPDLPAVFGRLARGEGVKYAISP